MGEFIMRFSTLLILFFGCLFARELKADLITNGGFESPLLNQGDFLTIVPGAEPEEFAWTVDSGSVDVAHLPVVPFVEFPASEGNQGLDMNGVGLGQISQEFATVPGTAYLLTFVYADNPFESGVSEADIIVSDVELGTVLLSSSIEHSTSTNGSIPAANELFFSEQFTAVGNSTRLTFISTSASGTASGGILLDAINVGQMVLVGDVNCDGVINLLDVAPFVELLSAGGFSKKADINQDGVLNLLDVGPFVALLVG